MWIFDKLCDFGRWISNKFKSACKWVSDKFHAGVAALGIHASNRSESAKTKIGRSFNAWVAKKCNAVVQKHINKLNNEDLVIKFEDTDIYTGPETKETKVDIDESNIDDDVAFEETSPNVSVVVPEPDFPNNIEINSDEDEDEDDHEVTITRFKLNMRKWTCTWWHNKRREIAFLSARENPDCDRQNSEENPWDSLPEDVYDRLVNAWAYANQIGKSVYTDCPDGIARIMCTDGSWTEYRDYLTKYHRNPPMTNGEWALKHLNDAQRKELDKNRTEAVKYTSICMSDEYFKAKRKLKGKGLKKEEERDILTHKINRKDAIKEYRNFVWFNRMVNHRPEEGYVFQNAQSPSIPSIPVNYDEVKDYFIEYYDAISGGMEKMKRLELRRFDARKEASFLASVAA